MKTLKTLLLLFTLICSISNAFSEELLENPSAPENSEVLQGFIEQEVEIVPSIELDKSIEGAKLDLGKIRKIKSSPKIVDKTILEIPKGYAQSAKFSSVEYLMAPVSSNYAIRSGRWSYGTIFNSAIDTTELKSSTGLFARYDTKHWAMETAVSRSDSIFNYKDTFVIAPEVKFSRALSLKEVFQTDLGRTKSKTELVLMYKPFVRNHPDLLQFEVGAGQSFNQNQTVGQSFRFSTKIRL